MTVKAMHTGLRYQEERAGLHASCGDEDGMDPTTANAWVCAIDEGTLT